MWAQRTSSPLPLADSVEYTLKTLDGGVETIKLPFAVLKPVSFDGNVTTPYFYEKYCSPASSTHARLENAQIEEEIPLEPAFKLPGTRGGAKMSSPLPERPLPLTSPSNRISQIFHLNSDTAVMKIGSFVRLISIPR